MAERSSARRARADRIARGVIRLCGVLSVAILLGIFALLASNAVAAFTGGIESQPITAEERAKLTPKDIAEIEKSRAETPTPAGFLGSDLWRPDAKGDSSYGVLSMLVSTLLTTLVAMLIAAPLGIAAAAWLAFVARGRLRETVKFGVELLAAIPSVVVGFVGIQFVGPLIGWTFDEPGGLTALNGAVLLAIMALPTIVSISEDALNAVPRAWLDASLALSADRFQTLLRIAVPAARSGLFAACMLGMGRAIGETMTVLMATGNVAAMPSSLLDPVRTLTATIAIELGEVPQGTTHYHALFAVGLFLFLITLGVNLAADWVRRRQERVLGS